MKKLLYIFLLVFVFIPCIAYARLSGYAYEKQVTLTGSSAGATASGYVVEIPVSPYADTVETGTWTVNETAYTKRIAITLIERTGEAFSTDPVMIEVDTTMLNTTRSLFHSGSVGDEVDFSEDASTGLYYYFRTSEFPNTRTRYFVQVDLTAYQTKTVYMYFGPDVTTHSDMKSAANVFTDDYNATYQVNASNGDIRYVGANGQNINDTYVPAGGFVSGGQATGGMHFPAVALPNNVDNSYIMIDSAKLQVASHASLSLDSGDYITQIYGEDADDATVFTTSEVLTDRTLTTAHVSWTISGTWTDTTWYEKDITTVVGEIVSRSGWATGNDINIFMYQSDQSTITYRRACYSYDASSTYAAKLDIVAYKYPDWGRQPTVRIQTIVNAKVYLDGQCQHYPYDVAFTASDRTTQLYQYDYPESLRTGTNSMTIFGVKLTESIPQSGELKIYANYKNDNVTAKHDHWSAANTFTFFEDDWSAGLDDWKNIAGTWTSSGVQQQPIVKGGPRGWGRAPIMVPKDGDYYLFMQNNLAWRDWYGDAGAYAFWRLPSRGVSLWKSEDLEGYYRFTFNIFEDCSDWANHDNYPSVEGIYACSITERNGTYYMSYVAQGYDPDTLTYTDPCGIATSTDLETWTPYASNPVFTLGDQGSPQGKAADYYLFWETGNTSLFPSDGEGWILYIAYLNQGSTYGVHYATRDDADPRGAFVYGGQCLDPETYIEAINVVKDGSTYYMFAGDLYGTDPYRQKIVYSSSSNPISGWDTTPNDITITTYDMGYTLQGMPKLWKDGSDWYMVYCCQPRSANLVSDTNIDDFIGYAKATSFPGTWAVQRTPDVLSLTSTGSRDILITDTSTYEDCIWGGSFLLKYNQENAGLVFRYQDSSNYYYSIFDRSENNIKLYKYYQDLNDSTYTWGHWDFEDVLTDSSTQGNTLSVGEGSASYSTTGAHSGSKAIYLNGSTTLTRTNANLPTNFPGKATYTKLSAGIWFRASSSVSSLQVLVIKGVFGYPTWDLFVSGGHFGAQIYGPDSSTGITIVGSTTLSLNTDYFGMVTWDGSKVRLYLYTVGGSLVEDATAQDFTATTHVNTYALSVGNFATGSTGFFTGYCDDLVVSTDCFTQAEIQEIIDDTVDDADVGTVLNTLITSATLDWTLSPSGTVYPLLAKLYDNRIIISASQYGTYWKDYINTTDSDIPNAGNLGIIGLSGTLDVFEVFSQPYIYPEPTSSLGRAILSTNTIMLGKPW